MSDLTTSTGGTTSSTTTTGGSVGSGEASSSVTSESRPTSFAEAFEAVGASDTPNPEGSTPDPSAPAPATEEPVSAAADPSVDATGQPAKGPIPFERHEAILANTREKAQREVVSQVQQKYGGGIQLQQAMQADPVGTLTQLIDEAVDHPELGQHVISALARKLGARRNQGPDLTPIDTEIGRVYTAEQMEAIVEQKLSERLTPIEKERQERLKTEQAQQFHQEMKSKASLALSEWRQQEGFSEHEAEIAQRQESLYRELRSRGMSPESAMHSALARAYQDVVWPKLRAKQTTQFVQDAVRKANASTSNPATVAPTLKPRPKTFAEAFAQLREAR